MIIKGLSSHMKKRIRRYLRDARTRTFWRRFISVIACIVVFCTTYALLLPAITMEKTAACGFEEHQHVEECFEEKLTCGLEEGGEHTHTADCYTVEKHLVCKENEHVHNEDCYDSEGRLTCALEEHSHNGGCYEMDRILSCGQEETKGHTHTAACYEKILTCGKQVHSHSPACYKSGTAENDRKDSSESREKDRGSEEASESKELEEKTGLETAGSETAEFLYKEEAGQEINLSDFLTQETSVWFRPAEADDYGWNRVDGRAEVLQTDDIRLYYQYTIPAGTLDPDHPETRLALPENITLTDDQIEYINTAGDQRGAQVINGTRPPNAAPQDEETVAAWFRIENHPDENENTDGMDSAGKNDLDIPAAENGSAFGEPAADYETTSGSPATDNETTFDGSATDNETTIGGSALDIVITFDDSVIEENRDQYEDEHLTRTGRDVSGFFSIDLSVDQINFETDTKEARILLVPADAAAGTEENSAVLAMMDENGDNGTEGTEEDGLEGDTFQEADDFKEEDDFREAEDSQEDNVAEEQTESAEEEHAVTGDETVMEEDQAEPGDGAAPEEDQAEPGDEAAPEEDQTEPGDGAAPEEDQAEPGDEASPQEDVTEASQADEIGQEQAETSLSTLTFEGNDYTVTATFDQSAGIPAGSALSVKEITQKEKDYQNYREQAEQAVGGNPEETVAWVRLFDISIVKDGQVVEPSGPVSVQINYHEAMERAANADVKTVHFEGEKETPRVLSTETEGTSTAVEQVSFDTESFSVFAIVETTIEKIVLASDGHNYRITATYGAETGIPADADLAVEEISADSELYGEYVSKTENALGMEEGSAGYIRLFDISIIGRDDPGIKYQPAAGTAVDIRIELADSISEWLNVVHFADGEEEGKTIDSITENGEACSMVGFQADSFSVYSIVDAPEPAAIISTGWYKATSLNEIEELGNNGFYVSWKDYYLTGGLVHNVTGNSDRDGLDATPDTYNSVPEELATKFYFIRQEGTDTFKIYMEGEGGTRNYVKLTSVSGNNSRAGLTFVNEESDGTAFTIEEKGNSDTFYISAQLPDLGWFWWNRNNKNPGKGAFAAYNSRTDTNTAIVTLSYYVTAENDPYELDGKTFGIAYHDNSVTAAAMSAAGKTVNNQDRLEGIDMLIRDDVLTNSGTLLVAENSDIQEWTFESIEENKYYIKTTVDGAVKYLSISNNNVTLADAPTDASVMKATPGTGSNSGKWHFTVGRYSINFTGSAANGFNAQNNSNATTWLNLVEKSTLTEDDFVAYSARKISVSDDSIGAEAEEKARIIVYTRVWNETTKKYEFYAVDHDGSLIRVYDSGDMINWTGNKVNSALWEFTEYTNTDGTPNYYYELQNTAYTGTFLVPQSESIIADHTVGINMNGRREGFDYTSIVAWDDEAYGYSGLKIERDEKGALKVVTCPFDEADDFYFAVMTPLVEETDPVTTVETVDNNKFGISIKMIDFNNSIVDERDARQTEFLGRKPWVLADAYKAETGLLSTNLENGYPKITAATGMNDRSLADLFDDMTPANHLFIQSVYNESGYFEYDSTQNFAHFNTNKYGHEDQENLGNFTVYNQLGAIGTSTNNTRVHGQFMPFNNISAETGYAHDSQGNVITNQRDIRGNELPDTDPRKGEPLYLIPQNNADYYYGMELSAVFTQTPDGVDDWGHDIIFEFTGDDDFWFFVDGELVLDLGGVHSAIGGTVNFRTGEVNCNGTETTLYDIFRSNYQARGKDPDEADALFVTKTLDDGRTVHVFNDYTTHEMKMFYMERGGGASNLRMRFNLASVKPGTVELSKKLKGIDNASNKLIQYPYQIWYQTAEYAKNEDGTYKLDENGNREVSSYNTPVLLKQPAQNTDLTGKEYASYKGTNKLIPYKDTMTIGGMTYSDVFLLKAGETAVVNFPEDTYQYKIVECGVDTAVYDHVYVNGEKLENEIFGKPYNNTDGRDSGSESETLPSQTTTYDGTTRSDFGITYDSTKNRPRVEYINEVPPEVMRTVSLKKVLYDTEGMPLNNEQAAQIKDVFTFRLYLGNEFADQENLLPANMYTYYVKAPDGNYCKWDKANQKFVSLGVNTFEGFKALSKDDQDAGTFTTSMYGSVSKIPAGYTVEVRDLIVGTKYKIEESDREIPRGYTRRDSDGYVRTDTNPDVVYYTDDEGYGQHPAEDNTITAEPISDTIADKTESPMIEIRNQQGWGLTAKKEWTDKDFMIHDPIYLAVYLADENNIPEVLIDGSVRRLDSNETEIYWFFPDLQVNGNYHNFSEFVVREVVLTGAPTVDEKGVVTGYTEIEPIADGGSITVSGKTISGTSRTENYTVNYDKGQSTGQNEKIRVDTVTNSRPGIQIYKTNWSGETYLSGVEFTLKDSDGNDVGYASYTSGSDGLVTTAYLNEGIFTLDEIKTPSGYTALDEPITIEVTTTIPLNYDLTVPVGNTTYYIKVSGPNDFFTTTSATETDMARITVKNRTVQELKVVKVGVDGSTKTPLKGVHFALYDQVKDSEGNVRPAYTPRTDYEDLVTNDEGIITEMTMAIGPGTYYLREKSAPSGYKKLASDLCFTLGEDGTVRIQNAGYSSWLTKDTSVPGIVSYQISIENTPLGITFRKTDETGNALPGAKFELCKKNDEGAYVYVTEYNLGQDGLIDLTDKSEITITGMSTGSYKLTETDAPAGYIILTKDIYFSVADGAVKLTDKDGNPQTYSGVSLLDDNTTIAVKNTPGVPLPYTGGPGTKFFTVTGLFLLSAAGLLQWIRRRRNGHTV